MSTQQTPSSLRLTKAGWLALSLSVAAGGGLRLALQFYDPERYIQTTRNDPRQDGLGVMMMMPIFAMFVWIVFTLLGYPLLRATAPPPADRESGEE